MKKLKDIFENFKEESEGRYNKFEIEPISTISRISEDAYLEKPTWLGGDGNFVCVFIDLNKSSEISKIKQRKTVAKIYDYFTQNIVDVFSIPEMKADYFDIKGDGVFGIYEGDKAVFRALAVAITFKTFFEKYIKNKFKEDELILNCKIAINEDKILVKKIGKRGNYNEVWAGTLVNNTFKLASLNTKIYDQDDELQKNFKNDLVIVSESIYKKLEERRNYTILSCGHDTSGNWTGKRYNLWNKFTDPSDESQYSDPVYYLSAIWCDECGDKYLNEILK